MIHSTILSLNVFPDLILKQKSWSELLQWFYKSKNPYSISLILASRPNLKQTHGLNYSIVNMQVKQWSEECFRKFIIVNVLKKLVVEWYIINISIYDWLILSFRGVQKTQYRNTGKESIFIMVLFIWIFTFVQSNFVRFSIFKKLMKT